MGLPKSTTKIEGPQRLAGVRELRELQDEVEKWVAQREKEQERFHAQHKRKCRDAFCKAVDGLVPDPVQAWETGSHTVDINLIRSFGISFMYGYENPESEEEEDVTPDSGVKVLM